MHLSDRSKWALAIVACAFILIAPAIWNGFPLLQYDTGGYLAPWFEHRLEINRSVPYGLLLVAGGWWNFWPVLVVQAGLTIWVMALTLRAHGLGNRPGLFTAMIAALSIFTTLPFLTTILLTDIFAGLGVLALYLLLLRDDALTRGERIALALLVATSAATHSATMAVLLGLAAAAALIRLIDPARIPITRMPPALAALVLGFVMVFAANGAVTGRIGWTPGGIALTFGRMLEDGIVTKYLDDHCPDPSLKLCAHKTELPADADDFFWGEGVFDTLGRFDGMRDEMRRIALESIVDYPLLQLQSVAGETLKQLTLVDTGAGIVNWIWNSYHEIEAHVPSAVPAMKVARQQQGTLSFTLINDVQRPIAWLSMALLPLIAFAALRRARFNDIGEFAACMALAILGNALVFGIFATAHNRYGARIVWLAAFAAAVALVRLYERRATAAGPVAARDILPA
ncbi:MAG TPA: hypothetical protein VFC54_14890 [Pseudolabrys sp.]|nr:hypothetical protein [Pseudolabrys sp.]